MLATFEFSPNDEKTKEQMCNIEICRTLVSKLSDPFVIIRYNTICAITNFIINYSENDIETMFIFEAGLLKKIEEIFGEYVSANVKLTEGEQDKMNKFFKGIIDLLNLIVSEIYDSSYNKIDFSGIIRYVLGFIMNPSSLTEEFIISCAIFICDISSQIIIPKELAEVYAPFAHKVVFEQAVGANPLIVSTFMCSLFYIYSSYGHIENVKLIIELIYKSINFDLGKELHELNSLIENYVSKISDFNIDTEFEFLKFIYSTLAKIIQTEEYSKNHDFLDVLLKIFRNLLDKYPNLCQTVLLLI